MSVSVRGTEGGLNIEISHKLADLADPDIIQGCVDELLQCASENHCLDEKVSITNACLERLARHNEAVKCIASCFGCA